MAIRGGDGQGVASSAQLIMINQCVQNAHVRGTTTTHAVPQTLAHTHSNPHSYYSVPKRDAIYCQNLT